jgi:hypothetical protein
VLDGKSERTVRDILVAQNGAGGEERDAVSRAEEYLREKLSGGPCRSKEVEEEAGKSTGAASAP